MKPFLALRKNLFRIRGALIAATIAAFAFSACVSDSPPPWVEEPIDPPSTPSLASPANDATVSNNPALTWNASTGTTFYTVQVSTSTGFSPLLYDQTVSDASLQLTGLQPGTTYYWRVSASNEGGTSGYSSTRSFQTVAITVAPTTPVLLSPSSGATGQSLSPILSWNPSDGASSYRLEMSTNIGFTGTLVVDHSASTNSRQVTGLSANTQYFWRVTASNSIGSSSPTSVRSFTTGAPTTPPSAFYLLTPSVGTQNVATNPTFTWSPASGATSYILQVATSSAFTSGTLVYNQGAGSGTSHSISGLSPSTTYYWRVGASNSYGTTYSGYLDFVTRAPIPGEVWKLWSGANSNSVKSIAWGNNMFVATTTNGFVVSPDGINWTARASGTIYDQALNDITWSGSQFAAIANATMILTSPDGINWTARNAGTSNDLYGITGSASGFTAVGYNVVSNSPDGVSWTAVTPPTSGYDLVSVSRVGSKYVAVGEYGIIVGSSNGTAWSVDVAATNFDKALTSITYARSLYVAVGYYGRIITSTNGTDWTERQSGTTTYDLYSVTASDSLFVAVGESDNQGGYILVSSDGINWSRRTVPGTGYSHDLNSVIWNGSKFLSGADNGTFMNSP
jgi:hypothetical protein